jgi:hypothetical protein
MPGKEEKPTEETKKGSSHHETPEKSRKNSASTASSVDSSSGVGNVIVVCRFRPLNQNELNHGGSAI